MAIKFSKADKKEVHKQVTAFLAKELPQRGLAKMLSAFRGNRVFGERFAVRQYQKFLAAGGKERDWKSFWAALLEALPKLIALLMPLFKPV